MSLLVIVPTRNRPAQCERLIKSFEETTDSAELLFVIDGDDDSYENMDWQGHTFATMSPRANLVQKLNHAADTAKDYDQIMWLGDDHVFVTEHWDSRMLAVLNEIGGSGWVYPDNKRRRDVPETWLVSTDIVAELGWLANPVLNHYYIDNSIAEIGKRTSLLRYCPDVIIEHRHYSVSPDTEYDGLYCETEKLYGERDHRTFQAWRSGTQVATDVSRLRRKFNPDVKWVLERVLCGIRNGAGDGARE